MRINLDPPRPGFSLADAIRKGAAQHPQCIGHFFERHSGDGITASCVLGAALVGVFGGEPDTTELPALCQMYPELLARRFPICPGTDVGAKQRCLFLAGYPYTGGPHSKPLHATLAHLNDRHGWTRERCAEWLDESRAEEVSQ